MKKRDMSYLAQALRWWKRQTHEGPIPSRHYRILREHKAILHGAYEGVYALTSKGRKMIAALGDE